MEKKVRYVALYENDTVTNLGRIIDDEAGLRGEVFYEGQWIRQDGMLNALFSPGYYGEIVSDDQAAAIAKSLGIQFD